MRLTSYGKTFFSFQVASVMKQVDAYSSSTMHLDEKIVRFCERINSSIKRKK